MTRGGSRKQGGVEEDSQGQRQRYDCRAKEGGRKKRETYSLNFTGLRVSSQPLLCIND